MRRYALWLTLIFTFALALSSRAQEDLEEPLAESTEIPEAFTGVVEVDVESAFIRAEPSLEAQEVASVFEKDTFEAVGRNIDGTWFEVRRANRSYSIGWISVEVIDWDFRSEHLPITENTIGLEGETPVEDTGFSVFIIAESNLRADPFPSAEILELVPADSTVPAIARDSDASWILVNYRGHTGWVSRINIRIPDNLRQIPVLVPVGVPIIAAPVIPPEIQLGQVQRFREYVLASRDVSIQLKDFWWNVSQGEVMPCNAPPFVQDYLYNQGDVRELPELDRYAPRFNEGIVYLNAAIQPLTVCGVLNNALVNEARNGAINAQIIFDVTLTQLDQLEELILSIESEGE